MTSLQLVTFSAPGGILQQGVWPGAYCLGVFPLGVIVLLFQKMIIFRSVFSPRPTPLESSVLCLMFWRYVLIFLYSWWEFQASIEGIFAFREPKFLRKRWFYVCNPQHSRDLTIREAHNSTVPFGRVFCKRAERFNPIDNIKFHDTAALRSDPN